jgi:hypothetical protein
MLGNITLEILGVQHIAVRNWVHLFVPSCIRSIEKSNDLIGNRTCDLQACTHFNFFFNLFGGTLGTEATTGLLYQPRMIGEGDCGEIGGMKVGRSNRSTRRKPAPAPLCPPLGPVLNRGRRGGKPATNGLSYGAAVYTLKERCKQKTAKPVPTVDEELDIWVRA